MFSYNSLSWLASFKNGEIIFHLEIFKDFIFCLQSGSRLNVNYICVPILKFSFQITIIKFLFAYHSSLVRPTIVTRESDIYKCWAQPLEYKVDLCKKKIKIRVYFLNLLKENFGYLAG